mmetsp:Transcript_10750/g.17001  ORF Transcript_10750/g.17001 Transcript_10750/m.17001 type:complete len:165 (+) Transcript_10750:471-965(+)
MKEIISGRENSHLACTIGTACSPTQRSLSRVDATKATISFLNWGKGKEVYCSISILEHLQYDSAIIGVQTFERNLANLRPVIDALVDNPKTRLFSLDLKEAQSQIVAEWEMDGRLKLPWAPRIRLRGQTVYTFSKEKKGRIIRYDESWGISAGDALLQLIRPFQ